VKDARDSELQAFLYRAVTGNVRVGQLVDEGRLVKSHTPTTGGPSAQRQVLEDFSFEARLEARRMGAVYELLYCLENSIRELIESTLIETLGPDLWWQDGVPEKIRTGAEKRASDDARAPWHSARGTSLLAYVDFPQYGEIIGARWDDFADLLGDSRWVENYFAEMNRSRRALAHTGSLSEHDVEWMEMRVKQWLMVVG
jgi:hypothetical protein